MSSGGLALRWLLMSVLLSGLLLSRVLLLVVLLTRLPIRLLAGWLLCLSLLDR